MSKGEDRYTVAVGTKLVGRYEVVKLIGSGKCSTVVLAWDSDGKHHVALKINRREKRYFLAAMREIKTLEYLNKKAGGSCPCVSGIYGYFDMDGFIVESLPFMNKNLYDIILQRLPRKFDIELLRLILRQVLIALAYLHKCNIVHTDIKPENILFLPKSLGIREIRGVIPDDEPDFNNLRLIDFGSVSATLNHARKGLITTRTYRAPEVILEMEWSFPCDMWSVGCMAYELMSGRSLFRTHNNFFGDREHLAMINRLLGSFPPDIVLSLPPDRSIMFDSSYNVLWPPPVTMETAEEKLPGGWASGDIAWNTRVRAIRAVKEANKSFSEHVDNPNPLLVDFIQKLVVVAPYARMTVEQALQHPFITKESSHPVPPIKVLDDSEIDVERPA